CYDRCGGALTACAGDDLRAMEGFYKTSIGVFWNRHLGRSTPTSRASPEGECPQPRRIAEARTADWATTPERCRLISGTRTSSTRFDTPSKATIAARA